MTRPKTPIYPRPVSPLIAEPVPASADDVYYDGSSDSCSDGEQHAAKRRRIEKLGEQYLRGDGLFIMTAGLKGPLRGWVNPWSKTCGQKRPTRARAFWLDTREERETAAASRSKTSYSTRDDARQPLLQGVISRRTLDCVENGPKVAGNSNRCTASALDDSPTPVRQNDKLRNPDHLLSTKKLQHSINKPQAVSAQPKLLAANSKQPMQDEKLGPKQTFSSHTQDSKAEIYPSTRPHPSLSDRAGALPITNISTVQPDRLVLENQDATRAKHGARTADCDRKSNTRSVHRLSPSTHLPEPECYPLDTSETLQKKQNNPNGDVDAMHDARHLNSIFPAKASIAPYQASTQRQACSGSASKVAERTSMHPKESLPPAISTQSSTTTNTNVMPSAQVVPAESCPSLSAKMIEPEVSPPDNTVSSHHSPSVTSRLPVIEEQPAVMLANSTLPDANETNPNDNDNLQHLRRRGGIVPFSAFKLPLAQTAMTEPNTQEMLATITPLGCTKLVPLQSKSTPATAMRVKPGMQKKRASFAAPPNAEAISSGSPHGSIKGCLKVSKVVCKQMKKGESEGWLSQPFPGKPSLDMETSDEDGGPGEKGSMLRVPSFPCSAPNLQAVPTVNTMTSTSSAHQQDAQQELIRRPVEKHNGEGQADFNLTSAMNDLGSFLGTWDADKEAREFGSGTTSSWVKSALKSK